MSKNFIEEIKKFEQKLRFGDSFALTRFSDGEVMILADWNLELGEQIKFGPNDNIRIHNHRYPTEDHKKYNPKKPWHSIETSTISHFSEKAGQLSIRRLSKEHEPPIK